MSGSQVNSFWPPVQLEHWAFVNIVMIISSVNQIYVTKTTPVGFPIARFLVKGKPISIPVQKAPSASQAQEDGSVHLPMHTSAVVG